MHYTRIEQVRRPEIGRHRSSSCFSTAGDERKHSFLTYLIECCEVLSLGGVAVSLADGVQCALSMLKRRLSHRRDVLPDKYACAPLVMHVLRKVRKRLNKELAR